MKRIILVLLSLAITACGGEGAGHSGTGLDRDLNDSIVGTWKSVCRETTSGSSVFLIEVFEFKSDSTYTLLSTEYSDSVCNSENGNESNSYGSFEVGTELIATDGTTAHKLTVTPKASTSTLFAYQIISDELYMAVFYATPNMQVAWKFTKV